MKHTVRHIMKNQETRNNLQGYASSLDQLSPQAQRLIVGIINGEQIKNAQ